LPDRLDLSVFEPHVGDVFGVDAGEHGTIDMTLSAARPGPWQPEGETAFAFELMFAGPATPLLPQATYRMKHPGTGPLDIFIVPLAQSAEGSTYQAVFS
jgi:hypothetical protein